MGSRRIGKYRHEFTDGSKSFHANASLIRVRIMDASAPAINLAINRQRGLPGVDDLGQNLSQKRHHAHVKPVVDKAVSRMSSIASRSKKKGIECTVDLDLIRLLISEPCIYCGDFEKLSEVDRKDSSLGYTPDNIVPACRRCNTIKNNVVTYEEMIKIVEVLGWRHG